MYLLFSPYLQWTSQQNVEILNYDNQNKKRRIFCLCIMSFCNWVYLVQTFFSFIRGRERKLGCDAITITKWNALILTLCYATEFQIYVFVYGDISRTLCGVKRETVQTKEAAPNCRFWLHFNVRDNFAINQAIFWQLLSVYDDNAKFYPPCHFHSINSWT